MTWNFTDANLNTSSQTQDIVITDVTVPVADVVSLSNVTDECTITSLTAPTATDNCNGVVTVTNNATLPIITQGTTVVTWTYDDGNGTVLETHKYRATDFPLDELRLYFIDNTLLLPSEY